MHWLIDEKGLNELKYNIEWFSTSYVSTSGDLQLDVLGCWQNGRTGFPIIDACMREVLTTGFSHYRGRHILSQFLVYLLGIDWTHGQKHFARYFIDYDWSIN